MSAGSSTSRTQLTSFSGAPADTISHAADFLRAIMDEEVSHETGLESAVNSAKEQTMLEESSSTNGASPINLILQSVFSVPHQPSPSILPAVVSTTMDLLYMSCS